MSSNQPPQMSKDDMYKWVMRRLGAPQREIELFCENLDDAYRGAIRWYNAWKGTKKQKLIPIIANKNVYSLFEDVDQYCDTVISVDFPSSRYDLSSLFSYGIFPDQGFPVNLLGGGFGGSFAGAGAQTAGVYSTFVQNIQYLDMARRINGSEPDFDQQGDKLYIFPIPTSDFGTTITGSMLITYKSTEFVLDKLNARDFDLILRYMLAFAKRDLGTLRDRYGSQFLAAQGSVPTDGGRLLQEAEKEFAQLQNEIENSGFPMSYLFA